MILDQKKGTYHLREDRGLLRIEGEDRVKFLHALTTNDVKNAKTGSFQRACILNPMGKILSEFHLFFYPEWIWLETDVSLVESTMALMNKFKLASRINVNDISPGWRQYLVINHQTPMEHEYKNVLLDNSSVVFIEKEKSLPPCFQHELGAVEFEQLRVSNGIPKYGKDVRAENIVKEIPYFDQALSYTKGCYPGQEIVARLQSRGGNIAKRLMGLHIQNAETHDCSLGKVVHENQDVGVVTSCCQHPESGMLGMAILHRSAFEVGTKVTIEQGDKSTQATVVALPL